MTKEEFNITRTELYSAASMVGSYSELSDDVVLIETYDHINDAITFLEQYGIEHGLFRYEEASDDLG